jgi:hypothetical protein
MTHKDIFHLENNLNKIAFINILKIFKDLMLRLAFLNLYKFSGHKYLNF